MKQNSKAFLFTIRCKRKSEKTTTAIRYISCVANDKPQAIEWAKEYYPAEQYFVKSKYPISIYKK
jgi:hypothetical protein